MVDHGAFVRATADYAQALLTNYDVGTVLYQLTDHVVAVLRADGAGVSLARDGQRLVFVAATDGHVAEIEQQQIAQREGPCHDAYRSGHTVTAPDLASDARWPNYRPAAVDAGARAVVAIPMPVGDRQLGALNIYRYAPHEWTEDELEVARVLANIASGYIRNAGELARSTTLASQLQHALDSRIIVEQAKGILAERNQITVNEAFDRLRKHARSSNRRVHDVAAEVVDGTPTL